MIIRGLKFVPDDTMLNFIGVRFVAFALSALIVLGSIGTMATQGLNFGIDFSGGTLIEIRTTDIPDISDLRAELNDLDLGNVSIQEFGQPNDLLIRLPQQRAGDGQDVSDVQNAAIQTVRETLDGKFAETGIDYRRVEYVGPQVGEELKQAGLISMIAALIGILIYVTFRFEWQFGVASIVALAHDAIATLGLFAITQMEFNLSTVAALLMIAGYSINDTVVVFDRIRENLRKFKKMPINELFNKSVNQTLSRTLMTSVTTLLVLIALWVFGGEVIRGFINALIFGILIGTYSSIFVASPVLMFMNINRAQEDDATADDAEGQSA